MGYSTLIDILGSMIIGGLMLLSIQILNENANSALSNYSSDLIAQQNLTSIVEVMDYDFSRIGYCENVDSILSPSDMIIAADSTSITFWTDLGQSLSNFRGDGIKDKLTYEFGPLVSETPNPNDRLLYRYKAGSTKEASNLGVTDFKIHYFDNMKNELPHPIDTKLIAFMQIDLKIEDCYGYDTDNPEKTYTGKISHSVLAPTENGNKKYE